MPPFSTFTERQGTTGFNTGGFGADGGRFTIKGMVTEFDLTALLKQIEQASPYYIYDPKKIPGTNDPRIRRTLPVAHPRFWWLFLDDIPTIEGKSYVGPIDSLPPGVLEVDPIPKTASYAEYEVTISLSDRKYRLLADENIQVIPFRYYKDDGTLSDPTKYCTEWDRYVEWYKQPAAEYLVAEKGQFVYRVVNPLNGPKNGQAASLEGKGQIRMLVRSATWKVIWHRVPYSYVLSNNSYFDQCQGKVNQRLWEGFGPGTALLQGVNVLKVYTPPFPVFERYTGAPTYAVSQSKLCDIELTILEKRPPEGDDYAYPVSNASYIPHGHNLVPYGVTGKWYYVESRGQGSNTSTPIYPSFPFELLFSNPDS